MSEIHNTFMRNAIAMSEKGLTNGGGPFGAVIVKDNVVIASAYNSVTISNDPTAHAEVNAIRLACKTLGTFNLSGCEIYTSCEPCPMCLSAIYWARIEKIFYANTRADAANIGFDDLLIYSEIALPMEMRKLPSVQMLNNEALEVFKNWQQSNNKIAY